MTNCLMRRFAIITYEGVVLDTDGGEAIFAVCAAVGTGGVPPLTGEGFDGCFGRGWHFLFVVCYVVVTNILF